MKTVYKIGLALLAFPIMSMAQAPTASIKKIINGAPVIDGAVDAFWEQVPANNIDKNFQTEVPTLGASGTTYWKAVWNDTAIFVLVVVNDDVYLPVYLGANPTEHWTYDKPEIYFDVNDVLADGLGASAGSGHYQFAPAFKDGFITGELQVTSSVWYAQLVNDPDYLAEYSVPFSKLKNEDDVEVSKTATIGFDVTILDADSDDDSPVRRRAVWANVGAINESWNNMDDIGTITLSTESPINLSSTQSAVLSGQNAYITNDMLKFKGFDRLTEVVVYSALGQKVIAAKNVTELNVASLKKGVYMVVVNNGKRTFKVVK